MNFVEQWQHDNPDDRHKLIPCPHLAMPDAWIDSGTRLINLIVNAVDGATTLALCGVCANTVVGAMAVDIFKQVIFGSFPAVNVDNAKLMGKSLTNESFFIHSDASSIGPAKLREVDGDVLSDDAPPATSNAPRSREDYIRDSSGRIIQRVFKTLDKDGNVISSVDVTP